MLALAAGASTAFTVHPRASNPLGAYSHMLPALCPLTISTIRSLVVREKATGIRSAAIGLRASRMNMATYATFKTTKVG